jgi:leucyl aminopeptidase (aminopeptidase T)
MIRHYPDAEMRAVAQNALVHTLRVRRGENLLIKTWSGTLEWAERFVLEGRRLGARPLLIVEDETTFWRSVADTRPESVGRAGSHEWASLMASKAQVYLPGPVERSGEEKLPERIASHFVADGHEWLRLVQQYGVRSARWDLGRTSEHWARRYGVSLSRWRDELVRGALVDPRTFRADAARLRRILRSGQKVVITHPNGTKLELRLRGREPKVEDGVIDREDVRAGRVHEVIPSGFAMTAVDESYAEGTFVSNTVGLILVNGVEVPFRGGSWTFRNGRLTDYAVESGDDSFEREFSRFRGGGDRPGLLCVGLNPCITSIPLMYDQGRGTVSFGIGRNTHLGGSTSTPRFLADMGVRGATLEIDGEIITNEGQLLR